jgi:hypothetical protein
MGRLLACGLAVVEEEAARTAVLLPAVPTGGCWMGVVARCRLMRLLLSRLIWSSLPGVRDF